MKRTIVSTVKRQFHLVVTSMLLVMTLLAVLPAFLPHNLGSSFSLAPKRALAASNPIVTENQQTGTTSWQFDTDGSGNPLQASNHQIEQLTPEALKVDVTPRLVTLKVEEPAKRQGGKKVGSVQELVDKLKNEARVI